MFEEEREKLLLKIGDEKIIQYLYLDLQVDSLIEKMNNLSLNDIGNEDKVPFTAKLRDYLAAVDEEGNGWLVKAISEDELYTHKLQEIAYYLDFMTNTLATPTIVKKIGDVYYRTTKIVPGAMQIGSYNYLEKPFAKVLANDLINRWLFYDEDRNPNNYMVWPNSKGDFFVVVIDYNKADLWSRGMKIKGTEDHFGWERKEKTRFLTLLKPDNFQNFSIEDFDDRLKILMAIPEHKLKEISIRIFQGYLTKPEQASALVTDNILERRAYINNYFRRWFKEKDLKKDQEEVDRYSGFGKSFLDIYKDKK